MENKKYKIKFSEKELEEIKQTMLFAAENMINFLNEDNYSETDENPFTYRLHHKASTFNLHVMLQDNTAENDNIDRFEETRD